jgi:hypothetical protein
MKPDREIVVCAPVAPVAGKVFNPETDAPYSKYSQLACPQCLQPCWIGERGVALVAQGVAEPLCMECAVITGLLEGGTPMRKLTDTDS